MENLHHTCKRAGVGLCRNAREEGAIGDGKAYRRGGQDLRKAIKEGRRDLPSDYMELVAHGYLPGGHVNTQSVPASKEVGEGPGTSSSESLERLWKDYFRDPSQWWDYRPIKTVTFCVWYCIDQP